VNRHASDLLALGVQRFSFTGSANPLTGRLQIVTAPQAALARIPESADGNVLTVAASTVQVYGASVGYASSSALYPAACNPAAPLVMTADVEVFSGFTEQLRNVYAWMTAVSGGPSFCTTTTPPAAFTSELGANFGLHLYQLLDAGPSRSAVRRTVQWTMNLPDNGAFWFTGEVWAELVPGAPTSPVPAGGATVNDNPHVEFSWTRNDGNDDGSTDGGFTVARPTAVGMALTFTRCGAAGAPYDSNNCRLTLLDRALASTPASPLKLDKGSWYQWKLQAAFCMPGQA
jgi:hypothetical protein